MLLTLPFCIVGVCEEAPYMVHSDLLYYMCAIDLLTYQCQPGYHFKDGLSRRQLQCHKGNWQLLDSHCKS